ncbi:MAG: ribosome small subunit-dependent GTPase A [Candidatus Zixiibacteriota bacterium]|nr:MAG: ribosome small subunit-dependent GTPase A [candidate division Zixibacteria bacterium]
MNLIDLGWNDFFEAHFESIDIKDVKPARIAVQQKDRYIVYCEKGELRAEISGKFRHKALSKADYPTVGDWVAVTVKPEGDGAVIQSLLPRKSKFSRKAVLAGGPKYGDGKTEEQVLSANVDSAFIVSGLDGEYNLRRLERYVAVAYDSGTSPVVLLNKSDLCEDVDSVISEVESTVIGVSVHSVSAIIKDSLEILKDYLGKGKTVSFLGSSGVGKSTIINSLLGYQRQRTGEVRDYDGKGRHTTTYRELIVLPEEGILIDTPGMREIEIWGDEEGLSKAFDDIDKLTAQCRFNDCGHGNEPGCAVKEALDKGELDADRYQNYLKLQKELRRLALRKMGKEAHYQKLQGRKFASMVKEVKKLKNFKRK